MPDTPRTPAEIAQASLDALDAERDALRARITEALVESTLAEANGGRPKPNGLAMLDPATRALVEQNAAARANALLPIVSTEASAIALRLTEGYEIQHRQDQAALMDADDREDDLKARVAELEEQLAAAREDARSAHALAGRYWDNGLAAMAERDERIIAQAAEIIRLQALADRRWLAYRSASDRAREHAATVRECEQDIRYWTTEALAAQDAAATWPSRAARRLEADAHPTTERSGR